MEIFIHAIEHYVKRSGKDNRLTVLHLAHAIELAIKASLLRHNQSIYENEKYTVTARDGLKRLKRHWQISRDAEVPMRARIELLIDERNTLQHRYGDIDLITLDYHMETAFHFMAEVLDRDYNTNIHDLMRDKLSQDIASNFPFITYSRSSLMENIIKLSATEPTNAFIKLFRFFETTLDIYIGPRLGEDLEYSSFDLLIRFLDKIPEQEAISQNEISNFYWVRGKISKHGEGIIDESTVIDFVDSIGSTMDAMATHPDKLNEAIKESVQAMMRGTLMINEEDE